MMPPDREPGFFPDDCQITDAAFRMAWLATLGTRRGTRTAPRLGPRRLGWSAVSTHRGVYPTPEGRWAAKIRVAGRLHYCGTHDTEDEAARAVRARESELLGLVARSGTRQGNEDEDEERGGKGATT